MRAFEEEYEQKDSEMNFSIWLDELISEYEIMSIREKEEKPVDAT